MLSFCIKDELWSLKQCGYLLEINDGNYTDSVKKLDGYGQIYTHYCIKKIKNVESTFIILKHFNRTIPCSEN